jgi:hypothetical protein
LELAFDDREGVALTDLSTNQRWVWPIETLGAALIRPAADPVSQMFEQHHCGLDQVELTKPNGWRAERAEPGERGFLLEFTGPEGRIVQHWELEPLGVTVKTEIREWNAADPNLRPVSPGIVRSASGASPALIPVYQGIMHHRGEYAALLAPGSHGRYQLGVAGLKGSRGGLSMIVDLNWDYDLYVRGRDQLQDELAYVPKPAFGRYAAAYTTYYRICQPTIFHLGQTYREHKIARGLFQSWEEKRKTTPGLDKMFGAVQFFIGYFDSDHDYVHALKSAKNMGFERAFVYPTVFRSFNPDMPLQHGARWINISALHEEIKQLGYHIASWSWPEEAALKPSDLGMWAILGLNERGEYAKGWTTGDYQWYAVAGETKVQFMHWAQQHMWPELTAQHFDVTGNVVFPHRFGGKVFDRAADVECRRDLFRQGAQAGPVSTEGFCDGFPDVIHCGSVMAYPSWGDRDWWTVPLNSIAFHDSAMNVWWECDSYNNPYHASQHRRDRHVTPSGGGRALDQSLWDALQGTPPHVFLCGKMYRPADGVYFANGYSFYDIHFADDATQEALRLAKPVADLHRKIGMQRMTGYEILTKYGTVQRTGFEDGTVVTVNFGTEEWHDGERQYKAKSWVADGTASSV